MIDLEGVSARRGDRHTFVYERVVELVERDTTRNGVSCFTKRDLADALGCSIRSVDRAIRRLRSEGAIESVPRYGNSGAQLANAYRATKGGR